MHTYRVPTNKRNQQGRALRGAGSGEEEGAEAVVQRLLPGRSAAPTASVLLTGVSATTTEAMVP